MNKALLVIETQLIADVTLHDGRRRRSEGDYRRGSQRRQIAAQQPVVRPEIVTPLRNTMGLIDGDQRWLPLCQHLRKTGNSQAFGSDKEKPEASPLR